MVGVGLLVLQRSSAASTISAATIAVFLAGIFRIVASMLPLQSGLSYFKRIQHEAELGFRMLEVFASHSSTAKFAPSEQTAPPAVSVRDLDFSYSKDSGNVLSGVSFEIPTGSYCALVGKSGAGKSTLVDLILGLYPATKGKVLIDGQSPKDYLETHPGSIGYVPQTTTLIAGTLLENITMKPGHRSFDEESLKNALEIANIRDLVASIPGGLDARIGTDGLSLSGGQAQRVGLARAIYSKPSLLVLDEATSALDDESEGAIRVALEGLRGKTTIIVIAHRPSTLQAAEMVLRVKSKSVTKFDSYEAYKSS
jgi:ABC-type multidrug transport system fused ATPase/permease subunit